MKKTFVLFSLFLMTLVAFARENEHSLLLVPRVDANPYIGGNQSFDLGNTSLYTLEKPCVRDPQSPSAVDPRKQV